MENEEMIHYAMELMYLNGLRDSELLTLTAEDRPNHCTERTLYRSVDCSD